MNTIDDINIHTYFFISVEFVSEYFIVLSDIILEVFEYFQEVIAVLTHIISHSERASAGVILR
jgi:hypothetical protein